MDTPEEYPSLDEEQAEAQKLDAQERFGPTPWQVICPIHGRVSLDKQEYLYQMSRPDSLWTCPPPCGRIAQWDDDNYEHHYPDPNADAGE